MGELDEPVQVVDHRVQWAAQGSAEAARVAQGLGLTAAEVEHIGSTAVVGLIAKPTIDLMLGVFNYPDISLQSALVALGYEALGEAGIPGRHYFRRRGDPSFNVHVVLKDGPHWQHNLALREYLRSSPSARQKYAEAKLAALACGSKTLLQYSAAKAAVVATLLREALAGTSGA